MIVVTRPKCQKPIRSWLPWNLANPADASDRRLVLTFRCCGQAWKAKADVVVVEIRGG